MANPSFVNILDDRGDDGVQFRRVGTKRDGYAITVTIFYESVFQPIPFTEEQRRALLALLQSAAPREQPGADPERGSRVRRQRKNVP